MPRHETIHGLREGFALPVALVAMIIIGAIVTGGFYASTQEGRVSSSTEMASQAFQVAEYGLQHALGTWTNADILNGTWGAGGDVMSSGNHVLGSYTRAVTPMGGDIFLISSTGQVSRGARTATRRMGVLARTAKGQLPYESALSVFGSVAAKGTSLISGTDDPGPGSICPAGSGQLPGVTAVTQSAVSDQGSALIEGDPPVQPQPNMTQDSLSDFGAVSLGELIASATRILPANTTLTGLGPVTTTVSGGEVCNRSVVTNWGEPTDVVPVCSGYMPIVYAQGNLSLTTGRGQGILIVEGNLDASGGFTFYGIVIVKGTLKTTGTGAHFTGSVIVQGDGDIDSSSTSAGNSVVQYSRCRVERAFNSALRIERLPNRSWIDLSGAAPASG